MSRGGPGRVFSGGLGGSQQMEEDSDEEFLEVKHAKSARGTKETSPIQPRDVSGNNAFELLATNEETGVDLEQDVNIRKMEADRSEENKETLPENIEDFGDVGGQGTDQQGGDVTEEEARGASVDDSQKHQDTTQLLEEVGAQMDMAAVLPTFNWADLGEAEMPDAGTRGIKGRSSEVDPNHTPDRGNTSKRRPGKQGNYQRVETFQELGVQIQGETRDLTRRTTRHESKDSVELGDPPDLLPNNSRKSLFLSTGDHGAEQDTGHKPEMSVRETEGSNHPGEQMGVITGPRTQHKENITVLRTEDGGLITEEEEILEMVQVNYSRLYNYEQEESSVIGKREEALSLIDGRLTEEQNEILRVIPDEEVIERTVRSLPKDKSPGLDGVVVEILILGWHFMKDDCVKMVRRVWALQKLLALDSKGLKQDGGLNWSRFRDKAAAMHIKCILRIVKGEETEWAQLARSLILRTMREGSYQRERCQWAVEDLLLVSSIQRIKGSPTLSRMLRIWNRVKKGLAVKGEYLQAILALRKAGINNIQEGGCVHERGESWLIRLRVQGIFPEEHIQGRILELENWARLKGTPQLKLVETGGWKWRDGTTGFTWNCGVRGWMTQICKRQNFDAELDRRWKTRSEQGEWGHRWNRLWNGRFTYRKQIWLWRLLQRGYFTGSRAAEMGVSTGFCDRCILQMEDIEHVFWHCRVVRQRREGLRELNIIPQQSSTLLYWIDDTLQKAKCNTAYINLLTNYLEAVWRERNQRIFHGQVSRTPISGLLKRMYQDMEAFPNRRSNEETLQQMRTAKMTVEG
ncbi:hypothetical protein R1sor_019418 [Riccia sorocarpa]|uniref:Reverse transcriptase zinc-binding domain-containing protein n=1 Tax=Riccia sorocarpa TaxID=122646 RepID=A0ABD3IGM2_9MARC